MRLVPTGATIRVAGVRRRARRRRAGDGCANPSCPPLGVPSGVPPGARPGARRRVQPERQDRPRYPIDPARRYALGLALTLVLFAALPSPAHAHLVTTGLGPVYDGISHLFLTFEDLLPVAALAFLAGLNGPPAGRRALFVLPVAWLVGGAVGFLAGAALLPEAVVAGSFLVLGGLTAADRRLSPLAVTALAATLGLVHGSLNGAGIADARREALGLLGIAAAVFVLMALAAAAVVSLRPAWTRIAVRVAGSWIAAIGLLLLGWSLRPSP